MNAYNQLSLVMNLEKGILKPDIYRLKDSERLYYYVEEKMDRSVAWLDRMVSRLGDICLYL